MSFFALVMIVMNTDTMYDDAKRRPLRRGAGRSGGLAVREAATEAREAARAACLCRDEAVAAVRAAQDAAARARRCVVRAAVAAAAAAVFWLAALLC